MRFLEL